jgi:hypothetical protein
VFGWVAMPEAVWLDISRFDHWIEDSIVVRWARLTAEMNRDGEAELGRYVGLLLQLPGASALPQRPVGSCTPGAHPWSASGAGHPSQRSFTLTIQSPTRSGATTTCGTSCQR